MNPALAREDEGRAGAAREYLSIELAAEIKSELCDFEVSAMAGGSSRHNLISTNVAGELRNKLRRLGCRTYNSDQRVAVKNLFNYFYPDVSVVCGSPIHDLLDKNTITNPALIVEVFSPSTQKYDKGKKLSNYQSMASVKEILLVAQDTIRVEHYSRRGKHWVLSTYESIDGIVPLPNLKSELSIAEVYDLVEFD